MCRYMQIGMMSVVLALGAAAVITPAPAAAQVSQQTLRVRKWKHMVDGGGQVFLAIQFLNNGHRPVTIRGIAPTRRGPWINVGQRIEAGATHRVLMNASHGDPAHVWVDTGGQLLVFTPPSRQ